MRCFFFVYFTVAGRSAGPPNAQVIRSQRRYFQVYYLYIKKERGPEIATTHLSLLSTRIMAESYCYFPESDSELQAQFGKITTILLYINFDFFIDRVDSKFLDFLLFYASYFRDYRKSLFRS